MEHTLSKALCALQEGLRDFDAEDAALIRQAADALDARATTEAEWQDISTAPKDGTRVVLAYNPAARIGRGWDGSVEGYWRLDRTWFPLLNPTHWMPLPRKPGEHK